MSDFVASISATNLITAFLASAVVLILIFALVHRFFWSVISRPIYAIATTGLVRKPAWLLSTAILILTIIFPGWKPLLEKLEKIV